MVKRSIQLFAILIAVQSFAQSSILKHRRQAFAVSSTLNDNIIAFWKLEEASGTRVDEVGTNDLVDNNTVTQKTPAKIGNGAQFAVANNEFLNIADNSDLSTGDIDFTFAVWVFIDNKAADRTIASKWDQASGADREWAVLYDVGNDRFEIRISSNGAGGGNVTTLGATTFGSPSVSTWYLIVAGHDAAGDQMFISVNDGTRDTNSYTLGLTDLTGDFSLGVFDSGSKPFDGAMDAAGFWKKVLTTSEVTELYNSGSGKEYVF